MRLIPFLAAALATASATAAPEPVSAVVVGTFHVSDPGHDLHNVTADDVLAPARQAQITAVVDGLARFRPTRVMVEWPAATATERYADYRAGHLPPSRNEVVQLGFRLAGAAGLPAVGGPR